MKELRAAGIDLLPCHAVALRGGSTAEQTLVMFGKDVWPRVKEGDDRTLWAFAFHRPVKRFDAAIVFRSLSHGETARFLAGGT